MTRFPLQVIQTIRRFSLLASGDRVLVAFSGGADSTALLHVLIDVLPRLEASVAGVAHVHHGLRGTDADADSSWCSKQVERLGLPFRVVHVDVLAEARRRGWSVERTAHALRHAALRRVATELGASRIALGHTRDDQAETVLLRFLRGAGTRGMGGMHPARGPFVRPLLELSHAQVEQFVAERGLTFRDDTSNADVAIPRNRVRHELLPALMEVAGRGLPARLARQADSWRADEAWLEQSAAPWVERAVSREPDGWTVELDVLEEAPEALRGRVRLALARRLIGERATARTVTELERFEHLSHGRRGHLAGWDVRREGRRVRFERPSTSGLPTLDSHPDVVLPVPGTAAWPPAGVVLMAALADRRAVNTSPDALGPSGAMVDADEVGRHLVVRSWRPGDALRPIGLGGSQKLQDVFVNRKVPRPDRARVPVVTMPDGRIIWVVGFAVDEAFAVSETTNRVVILRATHPGGRA